MAVVKKKRLPLLRTLRLMTTTYAPATIPQFRPEMLQPFL
jgi:hypothetical protein